MMLLFTDPIKVLVCLYRRMLRVDEYDFVPFRTAVFPDPVRVQDLKIRKLSGNPFLTD
jgi:hypothetical protein